MFSLFYYFFAFIKNIKYNLYREKETENNEQKQKKKQVEKILDELVGGMMPTRTRIDFFARMSGKGIKGRHQERVRSKVLKTIKNEVENDELEPTTEAINQRIEQILTENSDVEVLEKRRAKSLSQKNEFEEKFGVSLEGKKWFKCSIEEVKYSTFTNQPVRNFDNAYVPTPTPATAPTAKPALFQFTIFKLSNHFYIFKIL